MGQSTLAENHTIADRGQGRRAVLVVDDDVQFRGYLSELLDSHGFRVLQAANGKEGLEICRRYHPDLVITDIVMPEEEGIGMIWNIRRDTATMPIIAISGGNRGYGADYLRMATRLGVNATLAKPFSHRDLMQAVQRLLGFDQQGVKDE